MVGGGGGVEMGGVVGWGVSRGGGCGIVMYT